MTGWKSYVDNDGPVNNFFFLSLMPLVREQIIDKYGPLIAQWRDSDASEDSTIARLSFRISRAWVVSAEYPTEDSVVAQLAVVAAAVRYVYRSDYRGN